MIGFHSSGKFEDFKALGALLELNIRYCYKIDCKNALELLPTMPWAGQIQKLNLGNTNAEGTKNIRYFAHQSALSYGKSPPLVFQVSSPAPSSA